MTHAENRGNAGVSSRGFEIDGTQPTDMGAEYAGEVRDFSEDEEAAYVASHSNTDSELLEDNGEIDLTSGNVVSVESERRKERQERTALLRRDGSPYEPQADRPLILFDLNGVLVHHRFDGKSHVHTLRPGVNNLVRLKDRGYDLGIYSSATERTVKIALTRLERGIGKGDGQLFDVVLHREHCALASEVGCMRAGGKPWDTVKPLAKYFGAHRVVLMDDSSHKSYPGEEASMVILPTWEDDDAESRPGCEVLKLLTDIFAPTQDHQSTVDTSNGDADGDRWFEGIVERARGTTFEKAPHSSNAEVIELLDILDSDFDEGEVQIDVHGNDDEEDVALLPVFAYDGAEASTPRPAEEGRARSSSAADGGPSTSSKRQKVAAKPMFSALHHEMERFLHEASPTDYELLRVEHVLGVINQCTKELWPRGNALLFGSQAQGLALPGADLDITVTGVLRFEKARANTGYAPWQKSEIKVLLELLLGKLMEAGVVHESAEIILARIPVLKFNAILPAGGEKLPVDISMGTANGITAMQFLRANVIEMPPLRPIVLFVKCALREANLSEVFTGGLGSYALINMVMGRLLHWGYAPVIMDRACARLNEFWKEHTGERGRHFSMSTEDGALSVAFVKRLRDFNSDRIREKEIDLGVLLWDFLLYFGNAFDYHADAVSVLNGGVRRKGRLFDPKTPLNLVVEDPQEPGKDISKGTFDIKLVQERFKQLERQLAAHCELRPEVDRLAEGGLADDPLGPGSILSQVIDIDLAIGRGDAGIRARRRQDDFKLEKQVRLFGASTNSTVYSVGHHLSSSRRPPNLASRKQPNGPQPPAKRPVAAVSKGSLGISSKPEMKKPKKQKTRFYAVVRGRQTGIFDDLEAAEASTSKFPGSCSRSFKSLKEAEAYLLDEVPNANLTLHKRDAANANASNANARGGGPPARGRRRGSKANRAVSSEWSNRRGQLGPDLF